MTTKADFTDAEWDRILEGPPAAGLIVSTAERGGTFREAFSIAKAYAEARQQHGASELLDEIVSAKPEVDRGRFSSFGELKAHGLGKLQEAVALLEEKATPEEVQDYKGFVISVAEHVARAKTEEGDQPATESERAAIDEIAAAVGRSA
jgi:hypothetical protein